MEHNVHRCSLCIHTIYLPRRLNRLSARRYFEVDFCGLDVEFAVEFNGKMVILNGKRGWLEVEFWGFEVAVIVKLNGESGWFEVELVVKLNSVVILNGRTGWSEVEFCGFEDKFVVELGCFKISCSI